ncbi:MBL fold metallo-hydrolase [Sphingomonas sp. XMGL2]|uniref:MBL fold metallo-hydrolase n=2 Tax=Sphingomonas quercus TaxID=2842451 RepID=A0ABS6BH91_9SPHN|nr:MBL fold metallo-hydrolase [Sphingomonas quercus]
MPSGALPISDHFDGKHFFNPDGRTGKPGEESKGVMALVREELHPPFHTWPKSMQVVQTRPPARVDGSSMLVTWIGHSTVLVQTRGLNILTDPVWAQRASPLSFAGPRRVRRPGVGLRDLPRIDIVLISHDHYDHLDTGTLSALWRRDRPLIVVGLENDRLLARYGIRATALDWGMSVAVRSDVSIVAERAHHWSAHGPGDHNRSLWCGFTIVLPGGDIYFAGDSGPGDMKWAIEARKHGPVRLALLPIGAYHFDSGQTDNHIGPAEAVTAFEQLGASYALGIHWGTFELTSEGVDEPAERLSSALREEGINPARFRTTSAGEQWAVPVS